MFPATLLIILLLALAVAPKPVVVDRPRVTLPFSRRVNTTGVQSLLRHDQARAKALKANGAAKAAGIPLNNRDLKSSPVVNQGVSYIAPVAVGSPPTTYNLIVDTGSSNTWIGADLENPYKKTSTSKATLNLVSVTYGSGSFAGGEFTDQVTISPELVISKQSIGVATISEGFDGVDGILGLGPVDLTEGTLKPDLKSTIPTVTDNLFAQGTIPLDMIGISFEPTTTLNNPNGEITWGVVDKSKFNEPITFVYGVAFRDIFRDAENPARPVTKISPASEYWGIDQSVRYGTSTGILSTTAGIVDTGTTLVLLASNAFELYQKATGGKKDESTGLLSLNSTQFANLQSLVFTAGGTDFELTPNAQIWPRALNTDIGGVAEGIYLIVADLGSNSGEGLDFINGMTFLERFYSAYDTTNNRVGLAATPSTFANTN